MPPPLQHGLLNPRHRVIILGIGSVNQFDETAVALCFLYRLYRKLDRWLDGIAVNVDGDIYLCGAWLAFSWFGQSASSLVTLVTRRSFLSA